MLLSGLIPIKDVNEYDVEGAGRFAVLENNKNGGHRFVYKRVVNGLSGLINEGRNKLFILVIEAINDDGISWSYIAKVKSFVGIFFLPILISFDDVLKGFQPALDSSLSVHGSFIVS